MLYERLKLLYGKAFESRRNSNNATGSKLRKWINISRATGSVKLAAVLVIYPYEIYRLFLTFYVIATDILR